MHPCGAWPRDHARVVAELCRDELSVRLIEAFARRLFAQRGKKEFSRAAYAAADGNNLRVKQIINRGAGGGQAVGILIEHSLCRFIAFFCAVDDELCIYILRLPPARAAMRLSGCCSMARFPSRARALAAQ